MTSDTEVKIVDGVRMISARRPASEHLSTGKILWVTSRYGVIMMVPETRYRLVERLSVFERPEDGKWYRIRAEEEWSDPWSAIWRAEELERLAISAARQGLGDLGHV